MYHKVYLHLVFSTNARSSLCFIYTDFFIVPLKVRNIKLEIKEKQLIQSLKFRDGKNPSSFITSGLKISLHPSVHHCKTSVADPHVVVKKLL